MSGGCEEAVGLLLSSFSWLLFDPRQQQQQASERASEYCARARETISSLYLGKHIVWTRDDISRIRDVGAACVRELLAAFPTFTD